MMADPLSVIAGVVGVRATASKGVSIFSDLVDAVQNAPDEIAGISKKSCVVVALLSRRCRRLCRTGVNHEGEDLTSMV
jgi:hypothetical protein